MHNQMVAAIEGRFKVVYVADRSEQDYWMKQLPTLRPGNHKMLKLKAPIEEEKRSRPAIARIDMNHHLESG